ncbi:MAG: hypothetical protein N2376_03285 [Clostridia bacterium]|nr:hypothetical protein [Clostridia bacterium]
MASNTFSTITHRIKSPTPRLFQQPSQPTKPVQQNPEYMIEPNSEPVKKPVESPIDSSPIYDDEIGKHDPLISLDSQSVLNGIIFSEILGKPKSKRMGR